MTLSLKRSDEEAVKNERVVVSLLFKMAHMTLFFLNKFINGQEKGNIAVVRKWSNRKFAKRKQNTNAIQILLFCMIIDDWKGGSLCFPNKAIFMEFCTKYDKNATVTNLFINSVVRSS